MAKATRRTELAFTDIGKTGRAGADETEWGRRGGFGTPQVHEAYQEIQVQKAGRGQVGSGEGPTLRNQQLTPDCLKTAFGNQGHFISHSMWPDSRGSNRRSGESILT